MHSHDARARSIDGDFIAASVDCGRWRTRQGYRTARGEWPPDQVWIVRLMRGVVRCPPARSSADLRVAEKTVDRIQIALRNRAGPSLR